MLRPSSSSSSCCCHSRGPAALLLAAVSALVVAGLLLSSVQAFRPPSPSLVQQQQRPFCRTTTTTALEARKSGRKSGSAGEGFGAPPASASSNKNKKQEQEQDEDAAVGGLVPGEAVAPTTESLKADVKEKMERLGASIEALAAQVGANANDDDSGEDYPPSFVEEQKRLRESLDWERPYVRDKPRNWDYITGLPVPRRIKIEQMIPIPDPELKAKYREPRPNDPAYMATRIRELFAPEANVDLEELRSWYIANRDWLGQGTRLILAAKSLQLTWLKDFAESRRWLQALERYRTVECAVTCHLQQGMREAEVRLSQNLGSMDMEALAGSTPAEQACMWLTLKAVLAKWEARREKYVKMEKRSLPQDRALAGTRKVVTLFQKMNVAFSDTESVMATLPGEMAYLDTALGIGSGTELRRWTIKSFCPAAGISVEELRERIRGLTYLLQELPHGEMAELNAKLCEIYRALALGTAEFETEAPIDIVLGLLPDDINDPEAPFPFKLDERLDAAQEMKRVSAQSAADKFDVYLKRLGVPFPESPKVRLEPKREGEDLWFDNWALAWDRQPQDWRPEAIIPESQRLQGTFPQEFVDKMHRQITTRKRTMRARAFGLETVEEGEAIEDNPVTAWNEEQAESPEEEKAAMEAKLAEARAEGLKAFEESLTFWAPDGSGQVLSWRDVEEMRTRSRSQGAGGGAVAETEEGGGLPHPKVLLKQLEEENARWRARGGQQPAPAARR